MNNIFARCYFYPLISSFEPYNTLESSNKNNHPEASKMADNILCLPIFVELDDKQVIDIVNLFL